jgi:ABC-type transport system involved in cytochrome c biogenesis permease subunit
MFGMGFVSAIFLLIQEKRAAAFLPSVVMLDRAGYLSVLTGLPFMTLVIVLGSIWANTAWGSYWNWDPKETASLVTWLIYVCYLVTRWFCRWRERRSAAILIAGFVAVLVTFFGNLVFAGLHSYVR